MAAEKKFELKKPFKAICIKPFGPNINGTDDDCWGTLELLKIYEFKDMNSKGIFIIKVKTVQDDDDDYHYGSYQDGFMVATHRKFSDENTVPIFREHFKVLK
jgi:hypothetical protein